MCGDELYVIAMLVGATTDAPGTVATVAL